MCMRYKDLCLYTGALLSAFSSMVNASTNAECPKEAGYEKYSEVRFEKSVVCITSNSRLAKLIIVNTNPIQKTVENTTLIEPSDIQEKTVHLEKINNQANLYFEYPNNIYLIAIDANNTKLIYATHSINVPASSENLANSELTLKTENQFLEPASIKSITKDFLFNSSNLELSSETRLKITSKKALLWDSPTAESPTKMYLTKGDIVSATDYKDGKLKIKYITAKGKEIEKWIKISVIL